MYFYFLSIILIIVAIQLYTQINISYGDLISEAIDYVGEVDVYKFEGEAGDKVIIHMIEQTDALEPRIFLFGPEDNDNALISAGNTASSHSWASIWDYKLPSTGAYTLYCDEYNSNEAGSFNLHLLCRQHLIENANVLSLYGGVKLPDSISDYAQMNVYLFNVPSAMSIDLGLVEKSGTLYPYVELYDLNLNKIIDQSHSSAINFSELSLTSGVYALFISDANKTGAGDYELTISTDLGPVIYSLTPRRGANSGSVTVSITGEGFNDGAIVSLKRDGQSDIIGAQETTLVVNSYKLITTFELTDKETGQWNLVVENSDGYYGTYVNAFSVEQGIPGHLTVQFHVPRFVRPGRTYTCWIEYGNDGDTDIPAPLFEVSNDLSIPMRLLKYEPHRYGSIEILGINKIGPVSILPPGSTFKIPVYITIPRDLPDRQRINFNLGKMRSDNLPLVWKPVQEISSLLPVGTETGIIIHENFKKQMGDTHKSYIKRLHQDATYLSLYHRTAESNLGNNRITKEPYEDVTLYDVRRLIKFEYTKASARLCPRKYLAVEPVIYLPCPGLPLSFGQVMLQPIPNRYRVGPLGRGWYHIYEYSLEIADNGDITIKRPDDLVALRFRPESTGKYRCLNVGFAGSFIYYTTPVEKFEVRMEDGTIWRFNSMKKLSAIEGSNGNKLSLHYNNDYLETITHSNGENIQLYYNSDNRIERVTGPDNQEIFYRYDASGSYLLEVEKPGGIITSYSYNPVDGTAASHALNAITYPDSTRYYYEYDKRGRLVREWSHNQAEMITYMYDDGGSISVKTGAQDPVLIHYGAYGEVMGIKASNGFSLHNTFNKRLQISQVEIPGERFFSIAYDTNQHISGFNNPLEQLVKVSFDPDYGKLIGLIDAENNQIVYFMDENGNITDIVYPDGTKESAIYDYNGNITVYTNRRLETIHYEYNNNGQIIKKYYPDGREMNYSYNNRGNLISAIDSITGAITLEYDDRNFLTNITYPQGYGFAFEYNDKGQRTRRMSHDGDIVNYYYDSTGRLYRLTDDSGIEIVQYNYDTAGRLIEEKKGNNTRTTCDYNTTGQLIDLINYGPDESIQSQFHYTYNIDGNRTSMTTLEGKTLYSYDEIGQLTGVVFPDGQEILYQYDASGNRVQVTENGTTREYVTNNMNQYYQVGDAQYSYDEDGNMISKTNGGITTTYQYDSENRLTKVIDSSGNSWEYTYDALGNRIKVNHNGNVKRYVHDSHGFVDIVAEYDSDGNIISRYTHGLGLVEMEAATGNKYYYAFDGIGHTRGMTNENGSIINSYDYSPFGDLMEIIETIENPFRYAGRFGVVEENHGLKYMRARYYDDENGRFISPDPIGINGGLNLYGYVLNNPIFYTDIDGLQSWKEELVYDVIDIVKNRAKDRIIDYIGNPWLKNANEACGYIKPFIFYTDLIRDKEVTTEDMIDALAAPIPGSDIIMPIADRAFDIIIPILQNAADRFIDKLLNCDAFVIRSWDPNEKSGAPEHNSYITPGQEITYTIDFENVPTASAPAQEVFITDKLSMNLDWGSFKPDEISFSRNVISSIVGKDSCNERVIAGDMAVDIIADFDYNKGVANWILRAIDPETGELPEDAMVGFLPPEDGNGSGQGYVKVSIRSKSNLGQDIEIKNKASIVFDTNVPINTNEVLNIIVTEKPTNIFIPGISDGSTDIPISTVLTWSEVPYAIYYDIYIWIEGEQKPFLPIASRLVEPSFNAELCLNYSNEYRWQIVACNIFGGTEGPVWSFTTQEDTSIPNREPVADAGSDKIIEATSINGVSVMLDATGSYDPDNDTIYYSWTGPFGIKAGVQPTIQLPVGNNTIILEVSDGELTDIDTLIIDVVDTTPPVLVVPPDIFISTQKDFTEVDISEAEATDIFEVTITNDAPSLFPVGTTTVKWTATDSNGNTTIGTQMVILEKIIVLGDVNGDNSIDIIDSLVIAKYYVGLNPEGFNIEAADVNCDTIVDIVDALIIAQYYVGLIASFCL